MYSFIIFFLNLLILNISISAARAEERCDWTDCEPRSSAPVEAEFYRDREEHRELPLCEKDDELACAEECRSKFDNEFHRCKKQCLAKTCVREAYRSGGSSRLEKSGCVDLESMECQDHCREHEGKNDKKNDRAIRCRRQCLIERCPNANPIDLANEAREPGSLRCSRCKEDNKVSCQRNCMLGTMSFPHPGVALEQLGCEKLCAITTCEEECNLNLGF